MFGDSSIDLDKVKLFQNPKDNTFVRLHDNDKEHDYIFGYDKERNIVKDGVYRCKWSGGISLGVRYFARQGKNVT